LRFFASLALILFEKTEIARTEAHTEKFFHRQFVPFLPGEVVPA